MWILSSYWKEIVVTAIVSILVWYVMSLRMEIIELAGKNDLLQKALIYQGQLIDANKVEYEANIAKYKDKEAEVVTKWKTRIETIYVWEDNNVSCEDAMSRFDRTVY